MEDKSYFTLSPNMKVRILKIICNIQFDSCIEIQQFLALKEKQKLPLKSKPLGFDATGNAIWYFEHLNGTFIKEITDCFSSTWENLGDITQIEKLQNYVTSIKESTSRSEKKLYTVLT